MKKLVIHGGKPLKGEITINGAKNGIVSQHIPHVNRKMHKKLCF